MMQFMNQQNQKNNEDHLVDETKVFECSTDDDFIDVSEDNSQ